MQYTQEIQLFGLTESIKQYFNEYNQRHNFSFPHKGIDQRPKYEVGDEYEAFILKMIHFDKDSTELIAEQITLVMGDNYVLYFNISILSILMESALGELC